MMGRSAIELNIAVLPFRAKTPPIALCEGRPSSDRARSSSLPGTEGRQQAQSPAFLVRWLSAAAGAFDLPYPAIIDGEVVVVHEGRTNFSELQAELAAGRQDRLLYYAFDLLWLDGQDLRKTSQLARKE
jgi:hypothetical protein